MDYDGGCGDPDCELCKADAEAARIRREFYRAMESNRTDDMKMNTDPIDPMTRKLKCATCPLWVELGDILAADFERMKKIGVKCGDCVTASIIDYEEGDDDCGELVCPYD